MSSPSLRLVYLPANCAWSFTLGDTLVRLYPGGSPAPLLFPNGPKACAVAYDCGLFVSATRDATGGFPVLCRDDPTPCTFDPVPEEV